MKKKIAILFPNEHIAYSPTTLGIYDALVLQNDVMLFAATSSKFRVDNFDNRNINYFPYTTNRIRKLKAVPFFLINKIGSFFSKKFALGKLNIYNYVRYLEYKKALKNINISDFDEVIAIDVLILYAARFVCKRVSFLSLELYEEERGLIPLLKSNFIKCIITQTEQRYNFLFKNNDYKVFLIQNAPNYKAIDALSKNENSLLFNGTALERFGLYHCLNFVRNYPMYTITLRGAIMESEKSKVLINYKKEIENENIIFTENYMESKALLQFMAQYEIGFCFYDLSFPSMNTFNYHSAPSGKMFAYFAAAVPVIANRLDGLQIIEEFGAGILIENFEPDTILQAVIKIKNNYLFYQQNCHKAAQHFSFDKNVQPFVQFLQNN